MVENEPRPEARRAKPRPVLPCRAAQTATSPSPMTSRDALHWVPNRREIHLASDQKPQLLVVVDTEEDFDWDAPFDRANTDVASMEHIGPFQELCQSFGLRPVYVSDFPVVDQDRGRRLLREYHAEGQAIIGAHLHPWVTPPYEEEVNAFHSYPGNLPFELERAKLSRLTDRIAEVFGERPTVYKAGRYGFGPHTAQILSELGYEVDLSPCTPFDLTADGGPDYTRFTSRPYTFGVDTLGGSDRGEDLLCLPCTGGFTGWLPQGTNRSVYGWAALPALRWSRMTGILSRLKAVERMQLSPEGFTFENMRHLTQHLFARGERVFSVALHSPSLSPGNTPYVRNASDLREFMTTLRRYFEYFVGELGGQPSTPAELRSLLLASQPQPHCP